MSNYGERKGRQTPEDTKRGVLSTRINGEANKKFIGLSNDRFVIGSCKILHGLVV